MGNNILSIWRKVWLHQFSDKFFINTSIYKEKEQLDVIGIQILKQRMVKKGLTDKNLYGKFLFMFKDINYQRRIYK